jgi:hypothetical protein
LYNFPIVFRNLNDIYIAIPLFIFMAAVFQFLASATAYGMMYMDGWFEGWVGTTVAFVPCAAMIDWWNGTVTMGLLAYRR